MKIIEHTTSSNLSICMQFPVLISVKDYHEFDALADLLSKMTDRDVKCQEVAFTGEYLGVLYVDKQCPVYKRLRRKAKAMEKANQATW